MMDNNGLNGAVIDDRNWKEKLEKKSLNIEERYVRVKFEGEYIEGQNLAELRFVALRGKWKSEAIELNTETLVKLREEEMVKRYRIEINIPEGTRIKLKKLEIRPVGRYSLIEKEDLKRDFGGETLAIVSNYETPNRRGINRRVHNKIVKAKADGEKVDLVVASNIETRLMQYEINGIKVNKVSFNDLRNIIAVGKYRKIVLYDETAEIMNTLLACDLDEKEVLVDSQGCKKIIQGKNGNYNRLKSPKAKAEKRGKPVLSVIMRTYNVEDYIENAVKSLVDIRNINLLEIVIINDGSTDGTEKRIKKILKEASPEIRAAIVYKKQKNKGVAETSNVGVELAQGKYLRFVDPDDRVDSEELDRHLEVLKKTEADVVLTNAMKDYSVGAILVEDCRYGYMEPGKVYEFSELCKKYPALDFDGPGLSLVSVKTDKLKETKCKLPRELPSEDQILAVYEEAMMDTILFDDRFLYYYYCGREGQQTEWENVKANTKANVGVADSILKLLNDGTLVGEKNQHFTRTRFKAWVSYLYTMALDMMDSYEIYEMTEEVLKKYPKYYNDPVLSSGVVRRVRKYGYPYFWVRRMKRRFKEFKKLYG